MANHLGEYLDNKVLKLWREMNSGFDSDMSGTIIRNRIMKGKTCKFTFLVEGNTVRNVLLGMKVRPFGIGSIDV